MSPAIAFSARRRKATSRTVIFLRTPFAVMAIFCSRVARAIDAALRDPFGRPFGFPHFPAGNWPEIGGRPYPTLCVPFVRFLAFIDSPLGVLSPALQFNYEQKPAWQRVHRKFVRCPGVLPLFS